MKTDKVKDYLEQAIARVEAEPAGRGAGAALRPGAAVPESRGVGHSACL